MRYVVSIYTEPETDLSWRSRDTGTLDKEDCYLLAASLSSNYGFGPGISPQQMLAISEFAESYRLEDIGIGQLGTETYVPDELVIATSNVVITLNPRRAVTCGDELS